MSLIEFFITLVVFGLIWFLVDRYLPLPEMIKTVIRIVAVIVVIFLVLALFGIMPSPFHLK